jgi:hypothetical protein
MKASIKKKDIQVDFIAIYMRCCFAVYTTKL